MDLNNANAMILMKQDSNSISYSHKFDNETRHFYPAICGEGKNRGINGDLTPFSDVAVLPRAKR